jgi:hypothetical protein
VLLVRYLHEVIHKFVDVWSCVRGVGRGLVVGWLVDDAVGQVLGVQVGVCVVGGEEGRVKTMMTELE